MIIILSNSHNSNITVNCFIDFYGFDPEYKYEFARFNTLFIMHLKKRRTVLKLIDSIDLILIDDNKKIALG